MTDRQFMISAVLTGVVCLVLAVVYMRVRRHHQNWAILSVVLAALSLLATVVQVAVAAAPGSVPGVSSPKDSPPQPPGSTPTVAASVELPPHPSRPVDSASPLSTAALDEGSNELEKLLGSYIGTWSGLVTQEQPDFVYGMKVSFRRIRSGSIEGESIYSDLGCRGRMSVRSANYSYIVVNEVITHQDRADACYSDTNFRISKDGTGAITVESADGAYVFHGRLEKTE
ncbi:hypothetical protein [Actinoplanes sp. OR16]|uniref:hypothetical protein n=1 Tax=Actinoplanes sp. OR16 TaxID=946334 RepID=UPI000FDBA2A5|nr:hypothetical protein [Actinoplanes sp. OR16]